MKQEVVDKKVCKRCGNEKDIKEFRTRPFGFTLNQCRQCEGELAKERRLKKQAAAVEESQVLITSKSGKVVEASTTPIEGGRMTTSPNTDKVLYFNTTVSRDAARLAFSTFAEISRTGIKFEKV